MINEQLLDGTKYTITDECMVAAIIRVNTEPGLFFVYDSRVKEEFPARVCFMPNPFMFPETIRDIETPRIIAEYDDIIDAIANVMGAFSDDADHIEVHVNEEWLTQWQNPQKFSDLADVKISRTTIQDARRKYC